MRPRPGATRLARTLGGIGVVLGVALAGCGDEAGRLTALQADADTLVRRLSERGLAIGGAIAIELASRAQLLAALDDEQDALVPPSYFAGMWALRGALGLPAGDGPDDYRRSSLAAIASRLTACYLPGADRLMVVVPLAAPREVLLPVLAHEIGHVLADRAGALTPSEPLTLDGLTAHRAALEGHAEAIAGALGLGASVPPGGDDDLIYRVGREWASGCGDLGGTSCLRAPASSSAVLHSEATAPIVVPRVAWPDELAAAELIHEDVIGELALLGLLVELGADEASARRAADGWRGDHLAVYSVDGKPALIWRSVWRSAADATELARLLERLTPAAVLPSGDQVALVAAPAAELTADLAGALGGAPWSAPE